MVTVRDAVEDRVKGLDLGADDYIAKPFHLFELEARVRALIRRANAHASSSIVHGRLTLDTEGRRLYCDSDPLELTSREFAVIELLLMRAGRVVTKQQIMDNLYGWDDAYSSNTVEVFIHRLRKKLEATGMDIRTVRGMGYLIDNAA
jgi:two-component system OmpR family response regulator